MKLLLTSAGRYNKNVYDFLLSILPSSIDKCSILVVYYKPDGGISEYIQDDIDFFNSLGCDLDVFNMHEEKTIDTSKKFDVIWVCGGNTFLILDRMKKTGVFDFAKKAVLENNSIYFGISAGSIIAGPNIEVSGPWDDNEDNLADLSGMNIVNFAVVPHYDRKDHEIVQQLKNKATYPIIEITDDEAVFVDGGEYKIIK
jgi:peptidase E